MDDLDLSAGFADCSWQDWEAAALKALGGAPLSALRTDLYEGMATAPLYGFADAGHLARRSGEVGAAPFIRGGRPDGRDRPWTIVQFVDHLDIEEANRQLKSDLANGAGAIWLQFGGNIPYGGAYLGARTLEALERVFDGVRLEDVTLYLSGGFDTLAGAAMVAAFLEQKGADPEAIGGSAGLDPITVIAAHGLIHVERNCVLGCSVDAAFYLREKGYRLRPFMASGRAWHQAGGSAREELAYTLAAAVTYCRALTDAGWALDAATDAIQFCLTADADIFLTIAKFRAMRALWSRMREAAGLAASSPPLIAEMSYRMMTARDVHTNLLRATAAAFGAAAGGADSVLLIPFNTRHGTPDSFARRLARNTQLILQEEAQLGRVADPAGGSWYVERLTHEIAALAWEEFRRVEAAGGLVQALESGLPLRALSDVRLRRSRNIARGRDKITGVSSFPNLGDQRVVSRPQDLRIDLASLEEEGDIPVLPPAGRGKRFSALIAAARGGATLKGLERANEVMMERFDFIPPVAERAAQPFEELRDASDRAVRRVKTRPPIFLANLGKLADYNVAASWAQNFFAAGGFEVIDQGGFSDIAAIVRKFQRNPAPVACICAPPKILAAMPGVAPALKQAGAVAVYLAASRSDLSDVSDDDKRAIDRIVYEGCDALKILSELHDAMRVKELANTETEDYDEDDEADFAGRGWLR